MLKKIVLVAPALAAMTLFTTSAVAETEMKTSQCNQSVKGTATKIALRYNTDPDCGSYYERCDASGKCYECIRCTHGGPYCWEIVR